jgi:hypothetical protein
MATAHTARMLHSLAGSPSPIGVCTQSGSRTGWIKSDIAPVH